MVSYMSNPQNQITLGSTVYTNDKTMLFEVIRVENGFDTATITMLDTESTIYPSVASAGTSYLIEVKDAVDASYTTISKGIVRFPVLSTTENENVRLKCDGSGYGFNDTVCACEYGSQSQHSSLNTLYTILTDSTYGVVPNYVNKILGSGGSGFSYDISNVTNVSNTLPYLYFPYKPNIKVMEDLLDLVTAARAGTASAHWIVDTDDYLRLKFINGSQSGWPSYYADSQSAATLEQGVDFTQSQFEQMGTEANYIVYSGVIEIPAGEVWTEDNSSLWDATSGALSDDGSDYKVGVHSLCCTADSGDPCSFMYPKHDAATLNLSINKIATKKNVPVISFWFKRSDAIHGDDISIYLSSDDNWPHTNYFSYNFGSKVSTTDWTWIELTVGDYHDASDAWVKNGSASWSSIKSIVFAIAHNEGAGQNIIHVDDLNFSGMIIRIAKNSTNIAANKVKVKVITDDIGKYDTLNASDDSGTMAQMAYAELLRLQKKALVGTVTVPMIKDILPGQYVHVHAKKTSSGTFNIDSDMRITRLTHKIGKDGYKTELELTDDLTNSRTRPRYESLNKMWAANRPDFQDRQATSIKAGDIDITVLTLEKDYPS